MQTVEEDYYYDDMVTEGFLKAIGGSVRMAEGALDKNVIQAKPWTAQTSAFERDGTPWYPGLV